MRVALAGTHRTGKTTLIEAVDDRRPGYDVVDEPYHLLGIFTAGRRWTAGSS